MTFCNYEFTNLRSPAAVAAATQRNQALMATTCKTRAVAAVAAGFGRSARSGWAESMSARGLGAFGESRASYFSPPPCAVRRASSSECRMSIAIVDSGFAPAVFSSCSIARTSVADSSGKLTEVSAVEVLPFAD